MPGAYGPPQVLEAAAVSIDVLELPRPLGLLLLGPLVAVGACVSPVDDPPAWSDTNEAPVPPSEEGGMAPDDPGEGGFGGAPPDDGAGGSGGAAAPPATWQIFVVDIGQGDATVVIGPEEDGRRRTLVVDGGDRHPDGGRILRNLLLEQGVDAVDWVVLSHFDGDHVGGFVTISSSTSLLWEDESCTPSPWFPIRGIFDQGIDTNTTQSSEQWTRCTTELSAQLSVPRHAVAGGEELGTTLDLGGGVRAMVVAGDGYVIDDPQRVASVNTPNERSVALLISDEQGFDFLVTGDLTGPASGAENAAVELALADALVARGVDVEVLRVGHHGAANATHPDFVADLQPEVALISVGDDQATNYHHPRCATYDSLDQAPVELVMQTERGYPDCASLPLEPVVMDGTIALEVTGDTYVISGYGDHSPAHGGETLSFDRTCDLQGCR